MGHFFPDSRTRSRVRVRVRVRGVCHVHGFAQFSMARVNFRSRRPSGTFFPCPRTARSRGPCKGPCTRRVPRTWFCPVFHGARQLPSTTAVGQFFPVSSYSPFTAPFKCFCLVIHGARPHPSMKYVKHFFPVSLYSPLMGPCKGLCDELHTLIAEVSWSLASNSFECARDWPYR